MSEAVDPGVGALDDPAHGAEAGAVRYASAGDDGLDAALAEQAAVLVVVVAAVGEQLPGAVTWAPPCAPDPRDGVQQRQQLGDVVTVAAGQRDGERGAVPVGDDVVLRAGPGTVDRARTCFGPPRRACRCEPSITARDQSSLPARCSSVSST